MPLQGSEDQSRAQATPPPPTATVQSAVSTQVSGAITICRRSTDALPRLYVAPVDVPSDIQGQSGLRSTSTCTQGRFVGSPSFDYDPSSLGASLDSRQRW